jgi:phage tail sheath protein FI
MADPIFGVSILPVDNEPRPVVAADLSVVGFVGTAPAANTTLFPVNDPVEFYSDDVTMVTALGATGTLPAQIELLNAQLGDYQVAAKVIVVRIEEGADEAATIANAVGSSSSKTGIHALLKAGAKYGVVPRLIAVPGLTHQQATGIGAVTVTTPGSGYTTPPTVAFSGGGGSGAAATAVLGTGADAGKVVSVTVTNPGTGYTSAPTIAFSGGGGTGAAATTVTDQLANPVVAALPPVLSRLIAHAWVSGPHSTEAAYTAWRETINAQRLVPVETWVKWGPSALTVDSVGAILGLMVRMDHENGGRPFKSGANQPLYGIVGPNRDIEFSLTDGNSEGQSILANQGGIILRGEAGIESAIASGGFVYVGTDTASEDPLWTFYSVSRGRDFIHLMFLRSLRFFLGRRRLNAGTVEDILQTMDSELAKLQSSNDILGHRVGFTRDANTPENLRLGRFTLGFEAEEAPVLRHLTIQSARYRPALDALLNDLLTQLDTANIATAAV